MTHGRRIDGYEFEHILGRGAMGVVHAARQISTGLPVAIKWLDEGANGASKSAIERFEREAEITSKIDSPHIVRIFDVGRHPSGWPFLVMERLEGLDLADHLDREGALHPEAALAVAAQACKGLEAAHAAGVLHRDIKPANLFLARNLQGDHGDKSGGQNINVKILDFGIAKIRPNHPAGWVNTSDTPGMTTTGRVLGSPHFLSPEQLHGHKDIDARCDVFSLGVTLYTMLVGATPFSEVKSFVRFLLHASTNPPTPVHQAAPGVPKGASDIVERSTQVKRDQRFPSASAMLEAILALLPRGPDLVEEMLIGRRPEV